MKASFTMTMRIGASFSWRMAMEQHPFSQPIPPLVSAIPLWSTLDKGATLGLIRLN